MRRVLRHAAGMAFAVFTGAGAGLVHAVWSEAGRNRGDLCLTWLAWGGAAFVAAVGLVAIASLHARPTESAA